MGGGLRSKGLAWVASRNEWAYNWSQAGCSVLLEPAGYWWASAPEEEWPEDEQEIASIRSRFNGEHGDRHQELAFIGQELVQESIEQILDACLLTDPEFADGQGAWSNLEDPLPPLDIDAEEVA